MKKYISLLLVLMFVLILKNTNTNVSASNYTTFQDITLDSGKLLKDFTDSDYEKYYKKLEPRKFIDWKVYYVNKDVHASYVAKTIFSYYNSGLSDIVYSYSLSEQETTKFSASASGSLGVSGDATNKGFKGGLNNSLKLGSEYTKSVTSTEKKDLDITIKPGTMANLMIIGEGSLTNGVAGYFFFWIYLDKGGFEYFIVSTEYPRLEVIKI